MYLNVHWSTICNSPDMEAAYMFIDLWMVKKLQYIYTIEYYLAIKSSKFESVRVRWMKLEPVLKNEVSQRKKNKYHILMYMKSRKIVLMNLFARKKITEVENRILDTVGEENSRTNWESINDMYMLSCIK